MKTKRKDFGILLIVLSSIAIIAATVFAVAAYKASAVTIDMGGNRYETIYVGDLTKGGVAYENSEVFSRLFSETISDVVRMCVIKNQMETNGSYDPDKPVDIVDFANRNNRTYRDVSKDIADDGKVCYRLDDLIKWGNYGYDVIPITGTQAQIDAYFYSLIQGGSIPVDVIEDEVVHTSADAMLYSFFEGDAYEDSDTGVFTDYILVDRYRTVDGKKMADYVANRKEYRELVRNLVLTSDDLMVNYNDYVEYSGKYDPAESNVVYCLQLKDQDGKFARYHNLPAGVSAISNDEMTKNFTEYMRYVCFEPDKLQTESNVSSINSVSMRRITGNYDYSFGDGTRIWIAINGDYSTDDVFSRARSAYLDTNRLFVPALTAAAIALLIYIALIIIATVFAGRTLIQQEDGTKSVEIQSRKIDHMPIELYLVLAALAGIATMGGAAGLAWESADLMHGGLDDSLLYLMWGAVALVCNLILVPVYLILVRKIKCRLMWNGSLLKRFIDFVRGGIIDLYDNGKLAVRTWLPYLIFLVVNLVLVLLGPVGIFIALIIDILVGYLLYSEAKKRNGIVNGIARISKGEISHKVDTTDLHGDNLALANAVNNIGDGISKAVNTSMRDEKMKADLITNVSHDIKTPLTSIINYVDLLKRENIQDEKISGYVEILDQKSQRLKQLTDDLVEASKISSGNISLNIEKINFVELINQSLGEFSEKFEEKALKSMPNLPAEPVLIMADSRAIFRVVENLYNNIYKYALEGTRVYVDMTTEQDKVILSVKNISADPLGISVDDLTERFMRGDSSRKTEGSGLGLSIAKSLTEAMGGTFDIALDGDLFKVVLSFNIVQ